MHICLVYDCLFPWTIGGGERWYRNLGERLAAEGHRVTYLTLRQWDDPPEIEGIEVIAVGPRMPLYRNGKRRLLPPIRFGVGVFLHLIRYGREYDVVHTASFPYFSLLAASLARLAGRYRISCDWLEVWSAAYWKEYLGPFGRIGEAVQLLCARVPQRAYAFSRLHKERLHRLGVRSVTQLTGLSSPRSKPIVLSEASVPSTILYAGRFIPEKQVDLILEALAVARKRNPHLRAHLIGDGPTRLDVLEKIEQLGLKEVVSCPGFVSSEDLNEAMGSALCVIQPSRREGYGMIVVEASHCGVPTIVVAAPDNAATELVKDGQNGFVVQAADPELLSAAILECERRGPELRKSTGLWYAEHRERLAIKASLDVVAQDYSDNPMTQIERSLNVRS